MFKKIHSDHVPAAVGAYSQAVEKENIIYVSGQLPINPETNEMSLTVVEQAEQSLKNIEAILKAADLSLASVVKNTIFMTSLTEAAQVNEVYAKFFGDSKPARAMVGVKELPKGALIEIESIAIR
ncbi:MULTISPECIES: Rid family detoxifying hydrolase [unclassified Sporosarcina]|uniref:Rid family detoxifying hydrolase n=1 Tax=unclassified Sporosarcina TaxID=2647733 RepID=UPI000C162A1C|nr:MULTISPECIES: Rid family detoxifying hydrolase [unclassified Sporosarcina]PIC99406.1 reactive intermediate/imine deaminase [Sporosarcina sp. P29]PID06277.1 reactive intermediate/imine deaminase [Sporosarcina sp. P30]PID09471.1 reactive intermediate/imine deaminase [Sporosarcina sp. P31]PID12769.1 reactive intermediate/imine deaminase [Sporosarcina sp. P32b]